MPILSRQIVPVLFVILGCACATAPPPVEVAQEPEPEPVSAEIVADYLEERREKRQPPPSRRKREYLVTEREFRNLARAHPLGFRVAACEKICRQKQGLSRSEDGDWMWVLRCVLDRNIRQEPVVSCREDPLSMEDYHRRRDRL